MAQETQFNSQGLNKRSFQARNAAVSIPVATLETLLELPNVEDLTRVCVQVDLTVNAFDQFEIQAKFHESNSNYNTLYTSTAIAGLIVASSGNLAALAAGTTGWFVMETRGIKSLRFQASAAVGAATATISASGG